MYSCYVRNKNTTPKLPEWITTTHTPTHPHTHTHTHSHNPTTSPTHPPTPTHPHRPTPSHPRTHTHTPARLEPPRHCLSKLYEIHTQNVTKHFANTGPKMGPKCRPKRSAIVLVPLKVRAFWSTFRSRFGRLWSRVGPLWTGGRFWWATW